jgi:hypothetical protein
MLPKFGRNPNCIFFDLGVKFCQNDKNKNKRKNILGFSEKNQEILKKELFGIFFFWSDLNFGL